MIAKPMISKEFCATSRLLYNWPSGLNAGNMFFGSLHAVQMDLKSSNAAGIGAWGTNQLMLRSAIHLGAVAKRVATTKSASIEAQSRSTPSCALRTQVRSLPSATCSGCILVAVQRDLLHAPRPTSITSSPAPTTFALMSNGFNTMVAL